MAPPNNDEKQFPDDSRFTPLRKRLRDSKDERERRYWPRNRRAEKYYNNKFGSMHRNVNHSLQNDTSPLKTGADFIASRINSNLSQVGDLFNVNAQLYDRADSHHLEAFGEALIEHTLERNNFARHGLKKAAKYAIVNGMVVFKITADEFDETRVEFQEPTGPFAQINEEFSGGVTPAQRERVKQVLPRIEVVNPAQIFLDPKAETVDDLGWVAQVYKRSKKELMNQAENLNLGFDKNRIAQLDVSEGSEHEFNFREFNEDLEGNPVQTFADEVVVVEVWGTMTDPETGEYIVGSERGPGFMAMSQDVVIAEPAPVPFHHGRIPFAIGQPRPNASSIYPDGIFFNQLDTIRDLKLGKELVLERMSFDLAPMYLMHPSLASQRMGGSTNSLLSPGKVHVPRMGAPEEFGQEMIQPVKPPDQAGIGMQAISMLEGEFQQVSSVSVLSGAPRQGTPETAQGRQLRTQQTMANLTAIAQDLENLVFQPLFTLTLKTAFQFLPTLEDPRLLDRLSPETVDWLRSRGRNEIVELIGSPFTIDVTGFSRGFEQEEMLQRKAAQWQKLIPLILNAAQGDTQVTNNIIKELAWMLGIDPNRILSGDNSAEQQGPTPQQVRRGRPQQNLQLAQQQGIPGAGRR